MPIIKGGVSILLLTLNTLVWGVPLIILTTKKFFHSIRWRTHYYVLAVLFQG